MLLKLNDVNKSIYSTSMLNHMNFSLKHGEIHGVVGLNGAGKSSLVNIISGNIPLDSGAMLLEEKPFVPDSPAAAQQRGGFTIYQELHMIERMSIMDNIFYGYRKGRGDFFMNWGQVRKTTKEYLRMFGLDRRPEQPVGELAMNEKYIVALCRAFLFQAKVLLLDEPTAGLSVPEKEPVFRMIRALKKRRAGIIYVTHHLDEVFALCDTVTVMQEGRNIFTGPTKEITKDQLVRLMTGKLISAQLPRPSANHMRVAMELRGLTKKNRYRDISLNLYQGQILGLIGMVGAGKSALLKTIFGEIHPDSGDILLDGEPVSFAHPRDAIRKGVGYLTDERFQNGVIPNMNVTDNCSVCYDNTKKILIDRNRNIDHTLDSIIDLDIKLKHIEQPISELSSGNQQKVLLARWMALNSRIILLDEPTKGVDISSRNDIYIWITEKSKEGCAVVISSSEIAEMIHLCTDIVVLNHGEISDRMTSADVSEDRIVQAMQR